MTFGKVPLAMLTALAPHVWAVSASGRVYDNAKPRDFKDRILKTENMDKAVRCPVLLECLSNKFD